MRTLNIDIIDSRGNVASHYSEAKIQVYGNKLRFFVYIHAQNDSKTIMN